MAMTHFADERKRAIKDAEKTYNQKVKDLKSDYDTQIFETGRSYEDAYRENAVQKAINERQVAESMANMGLRDSGLNRTQQTAVQLGYANNNAAIDKSKRQAVDSLNLQKTRGLASLKQDLLTQKEGINQTYDNMEKEYKTESTKAYYQHLTDVAKMQKQGYILTGGSEIGSKFNPMFGSFEENNISVSHITNEEGKVVGYRYVDNNSGKTSEFGLGVSPFTGYRNANLLDKDGNYDSSRAFAGGYQPKYIKVNGKDVKLEHAVVKSGKYEGQNAKAEDENTGESRMVYYAAGKFYTYDKYKNDYVVLPAEQSENVASPSQYKNSKK